ncbi:MAG: hypothetical protein ABW198_13850 [Pseudorhodoplanes sp.]
MANIISFAERRNAKLRDRLTKFAVKGEPVIIETGSGLIRGDHLTCHSHAAEILNSWGEKVVVSYGDIRDVRPAVTPQLSTISDHGDFVVPTGLAARTEPTSILAFARPGRRR